MTNDKRFVYVLRSERDPGRYYTGMTRDTVFRLNAHNAGMCRHTASGRPWRIDVVIEFADERRADLRRARADRLRMRSVPIPDSLFQPLTSTYRVTFDGGLSQNYASRGEAFDAISRTARWKIAEGPQIEEGSRHYAEFSFRLDTSQLPRPMQIGIGGQADWAMSVQRTQKIN